MPRPNRWRDVVRAAAEEFREYGYDGSTLEGIADRVGMMKGSLYNYINTKEDLLIAVTAEPVEQLFSELRHLERPDIAAVDRLRALFRLNVQLFTEHYPAAFVFIQERSRKPQNQGLRGRDHEYAEVVERIVRDGAARGEFVLPGSTKVAVRYIVGVINSMVYWFHPAPGAARNDYDGLADELFAYAVRGLAGSPLGQIEGGEVTREASRN